MHGRLGTKVSSLHAAYIHNIPSLSCSDNLRQHSYRFTRGIIYEVIVHSQHYLAMHRQPVQMPVSRPDTKVVLQLDLSI